MAEKRIALIGSAPSSVALAPYHDPAWEIWACSPGAYGVAGRCDQFFELHRWKPPIPGKPGTGDPWFSPEYCQWIREHPCVWMSHPEQHPDVPNAKRLPAEELVAKYGPYFFNSSLAWMIAMAIEAGATHIGLWGVDMAAWEEYYTQRLGCQFFLQLAGAMGIEIHLPPESDLMLPSPLYGVCEYDHAWIKLEARKAEFNQKLAAVSDADTKNKAEYMFFKGAMDDLIYSQFTWCHGNARVPQNAPPALAPLFRQPAQPQGVSETVGSHKPDAAGSTPAPATRRRRVKPNGSAVADGSA